MTTITNDVQPTPPTIRSSASSPSLNTHQFQKMPPDIAGYNPITGTIPELLQVSATDSVSTRSTQVNMQSGSDSSIQGTPQRFQSEIFPSRPPRSRPMSYPDHRYPQGVIQQDSPTSRRSPMDLVNTQPGGRELQYSSNRALPLALYKSMSSNNIQPPPHISQQSLNSRLCACQCQCDTPRKHQPSGEGSSLDEESALTPEGLSWRRLHMSRAKLKATATTSELLSGFAMVAMVELQINEPTNVPEWLFVMFSVCTTVLVAVHIFALMISTYLLPNIDAVSKLQVHELVTHSPHERMRGFIELAWAFSTVLGLFLFLVEIAILCWVKFWDYSFMAAWAATIIVIPVLIVFVAFAVHFYHNLVVYKCESVTDLKHLEDMKKNLDTADCSPV
ncbi:hypothetical protein L9F63_017806 [Diploptera punctata]|uniref:Calcium release-activated calcium channel protein 1 n=1 Tax=Diploptera punctata TaxID=6984 RepID=A0AAD8EFX8_DIPPU|nr:hypothetical protein L9F63_017806 [Diploptera punctata]